MCIVSMMHDHYRDRFVPWFDPSRLPWRSFPTVKPLVPAVGQAPAKPLSEQIAEELAALRPLIAEYKEALAKAKRLDELTQQPDCADPEKAKLEDMRKRAKQAESIEALSVMFDGSDGDEP